MTEELVLVVLLTGLLGLIWIMTLGTIDEDHAGGQSHEPEPSSRHSVDAQQSEGTLKRHTIAA
jgi:hypothetical protein